MARFLHAIICTLPFFSTTVALASEHHEPVSDMAFADRKSSDGLRQNVFKQSSLLPDEIALMATLGSLGSRIEHDDDREFRLLSIENELQLSGSAGVAFLDYMTRTWKDYREDLDSIKFDLACSGHTRLRGDEVFNHFDDIFIAKLELLQTYLQRIERELQPETFLKFESWLQRRKQNISFWTSHHKAAYVDAGIDVNQKLTRICDRLTASMAGPIGEK